MPNLRVYLEVDVYALPPCNIYRRGHGGRWRPPGSVEMVRDRHKCPPAAMAALGELLFYITTEDQENDAENSQPNLKMMAIIVDRSWKCCIAVDRVLRVNHGNSGSSAMTDEVVQHYATKTFKICLLKVFLHKCAIHNPRFCIAS